MDHTPISMSKDTVDILIEGIPKLLKLYNSSDFNITFFGGEPLLNLELIKYFATKIGSDSRCRYMTLITNGLLLNDGVYSLLKKLNINLSLSFDGLWNKFNRPLISGESSLDSYIRKKDFFLGKDSSFKTMISPTSLPTLVDNFLFMLDYGLTRMDFSLVRDDIWSSRDVLDYKKAMVTLANSYIEIVKSGKVIHFDPFELYWKDTIINHIQGKREISCFAGITGCAISIDKKVYPCPRFASTRQYELFPLEDIKSTDNFELFRSGIFETPQICDKDCPIFRYCNGGCKWSQMSNGNKPVGSVCELLKITYGIAYEVARELKDNPTFHKITSELGNQLRR